ncbi:MAG: hypothetical protein ACE5IG_07075 [Dehalococcoidia bacterium]
MYTLEVLNPVAAIQGELKKSVAAPRPRTLDGLTLGLLWNGKRGGEVALMHAAELLEGHYRDLKVIRYDGSMPCPPAMVQQAHQECDVVIGSTAD